MAADWKSFVRSIEPKARTTEPATDREIAEAEQAVGASFPADLKDLFRETHGVLDSFYGPILPLTGKRTIYTDGLGSVIPQTELFPASGNSIIDATRQHRSEELAGLNEWGEETVELFRTFVVIGQDCGGGPFGFFEGATEGSYIRFIEHDTGELDDTAYTLEEYLRFFLTEAALFV